MPERARVTALWSGTITFGLVGIPVELLPGVRARGGSMHLVDSKGRAVGREYFCPEDESAVPYEEIARAHETDDGEMIVVTDEELESIAPEMTRDIELRRFVPREQIPPVYFNRPYYLAPSGRSTKAYHLLAETMERTGRVGIGTFVMRGHQYLVAVISDGGILRAETLRFAAELRSPEDVGLPKRKKGKKKRTTELGKAIAALTEKSVSMEELADRRADLLREIAEDKEARGEDVVEPSAVEDEDEEPGAEVVDLMKLLKQRLGGTPRLSRRTTNEEDGMPQAWSNKRERQYEHIKESSKKRGKSTKRAKEIAARTVNKQRREKGETKSGRRSTTGTGNPNRGLEERTKQELYNQAKKQNIDGRSKMTKQQLVRALRKSS